MGKRKCLLSDSELHRRHMAGETLVQLAVEAGVTASAVANRVWVYRHANRKVGKTRGWTTSGPRVRNVAAPAVVAVGPACPQCRRPMSEPERVTYGRCEDCWAGEQPTQPKGQERSRVTLDLPTRRVMGN